MTDKLDDKDFPNHRFDGAKEVPSYTSNSSAPAADHAGLVERLNDTAALDEMIHTQSWVSIQALLREAATALSAGVRVSAAAKRLLDHWDENSGPEKRGEFEGVEYWSPAGRMVDTQFIADLRSALSDAPVVTEDREAQLMSALEEAALALDEAAIEVQSWGAYASEYFQDKHDLEGCCDSISKAAAEARAAALGGGE